MPSLTSALPQAVVGGVSKDFASARILRESPRSTAVGFPPRAMRSMPDVQFVTGTRSSRSPIASDRVVGGSPSNERMLGDKIGARCFDRIAGRRCLRARQRLPSTQAGSRPCGIRRGFRGLHHPDERHGLCLDRDPRPPECHGRLHARPGLAIGADQCRGLPGSGLRPVSRRRIAVPLADFSLLSSKPVQVQYPATPQNAAEDGRDTCQLIA